MSLLPIGTRIRFVERLDAAANEDHPDIVYAKKGETGEIVGHGCKEGYWVKTDHWPARFGASREEFEPLQGKESHAQATQTPSPAHDAPGDVAGQTGSGTDASPDGKGG